ncbi:MAG: hypothetical protein IJC77_04665 [Bacteroidaceae bacterium]|nr:hypothetical protein [Bacteroidaceae bacterium]
MKKILYLLVIVFLSSCSNDDTVENLEEKQTLTGWYMLDLENMPYQDDFDEINKAIENNEVLKKYSSREYRASYSLFIDSEGRYGDTGPEFGRLRFSIDNFCAVIHIVDDSTLKLYSGALFVVNSNNKNEMLYKLYAGPIFGHMAYYSESCRYYTYTKVDNKLVVSNGSIYTIVDGKLIEDGSSTSFSKYDPSKEY